MNKLKLYINRISEKTAAFSARKKYRIITATTMAVLYFSIFIFMVDTRGLINVEYGSDAWDYQSIAVNYAKGHGFHVSGRLEPIETYRFGHLDQGVEEKQELLAGIPNIHRPPLYPLTIGFIYRIFGVNPALVVVLQLLLLCLTAAALCLIGFLLAGNKGFWAGVLAGLIFMCTKYSMAEVFLPGQAFTVFLIAVFVFVTEHFFRKPTPWGAALSAFVLSISLLFHGSMILVPGFMGMYFIVKLFKYGFQKNLTTFFVFSAVLFFALLPWHLYAYKTLRILKNDAAVIVKTITDTTKTQTDKEAYILKRTSAYGALLMPRKEFSSNDIRLINDSLIPLVKDKGVLFTGISETTMPFYNVALLQEIIDAPDYFLLFLSVTKNMAMDCHNEFIDNGFANPAWRYDSASFYATDGMADKISFLRVFNFYKHYPSSITAIANAKINAAYSYSLYLKIFIVFFIVVVLAKSFPSQKRSLMALVFFLTLLWFFVVFRPLSLTAFLLMAFLVIYASAHKMAKGIPMSFVFILYNLFIFTVIALGNNRYIEVLDPIIIYCAVYMLIHSLSLILPKGKSTLLPTGITNENAGYN